MIAENEVLFVVDGDNLYRQAQEKYGQDYRVSYSKLQEFVRQGRPYGTCYHMVVFVTIKAGKNKQLGFVSRLNMFGYETRTFLSTYDEQTGVVERRSISDSMIEYIRDFRCHGDIIPKTIVVASSSGAFADLYVALAYLGVSIEVLYANTVSQKIDEVSRLVALAPECFYKMPEQLQEKQ